MFELMSFSGRPEGSTVEDEQRAWMRELEQHLRGEDEPRTWGNTQPSGMTALELDADTADPAVLSDAGLIDAMVGFERVAAWAQARQARMLAEFARRRPGDEPSMAAQDKACAMSRFAPDEVGLALRLPRMTATARLSRSEQLEQVLPETLQAWERGRLDERRVTAICDATHYLPVGKARAVQQRVLARAPEHTPPQLRAALRRAVEKVDPDGVTERHQSARRDRRVVVGEEQEGMASLWALLSAPDARSCYQWLTRLAQGCDTADPRGMDARRADLLVGLLTGVLTYAAPDTDTDPRSDSGSDPGSGVDADSDSDSGADTSTVAVVTGGGGVGGESVPPRPVNPGKPLVQVLMPFTTLIGADQQPCELVGHGPIPAELTREIAADATLKRLVYDPLSGTVLDHGRTTYRPPAGLADHVRARDVYCRSPICRRRVLDGHLDHIEPFPHGPTNEKNLSGCCGHDHQAKHAPGWQVRALPDGRIQWITPTGHRYHSHPHDYRPDTDPPPMKPSPPPEPDEPEPPSPPPLTQREIDAFLATLRDTDTGPPDEDDPAPF